MYYIAIKQTYYILYRNKADLLYTISLYGRPAIYYIVIKQTYYILYRNKTDLLYTISL